jgi:hypothetical protein
MELLPMELGSSVKATTALRERRELYGSVLGQMRYWVEMHPRYEFTMNKLSRTTSNPQEGDILTLKSVVANAWPHRRDGITCGGKRAPHFAYAAAAAAGHQSRSHSQLRN